MIDATAKSPCQGALWFASKGRPVLPLHSIDDAGCCTCGRTDCDSPAKHPFARFARRGLKDATADSDVVADWFARRKRLNYGVVTAGLVVIDIDARHGGLERWDALACKPKQPLISTWTVDTGGGGKHLFFKSDDFTPGKLELGIDVKAGAGAYVVGPGCRHASGRRYRWAPQQSPEDVRLAALPDWLSDLIKERMHIGTPVSREEWRARVQEPAREGERHTKFLQIAGHLLAKSIDPNIVRELMLAWNPYRCEPPLDEHDADTMLENLMQRELAKISRGATP